MGNLNFDYDPEDSERGHGRYVREESSAVEVGGGIAKDGTL